MAYDAEDARPHWFLIASGDRPRSFCMRGANAREENVVRASAFDEFARDAIFFFISAFDAR